MAVRDRNLFAWQAYVVTMAIVSFGLLLGAFFLWRWASDAQTQLDDTRARLEQSNQDAVQDKERIKRLMSMMGYDNYTDGELQAMAEQFANDEVLSKVETDFAEQIKLFPPNQKLSEKNLLKLPKFLLDTIRIRNEQVDSARDRETKIQTDLTQTLQRETAAREDAVNKQKQAEADLAAARQSHSAEIARLNAEKEEALQRFAKYEQDFNQKLLALRNENQQLTTVNSEQLVTIETQMDQINQFRNPDFAAPQGRITNVANAGQTVWIDLGKEDGLRVGVPFSVIDESELNISEAEPKARMRITRVVADHLSMAEVSNYNPRKPILTGDKVYSPAWRPGRTVGFALIGEMDINNDGKDDVEQVRELIRLAGGVIDEEIDPKGNRTGVGITANTSFLVMGTDVTLPENASPELRAQQVAKATKYERFRAEALRKGISEWNLDKLMGYLKTEGSDRTVPLGNRIRGSDFPIRSPYPPPASTGRVSDIYQPKDSN